MDTNKEVLVIEDHFDIAQIIASRLEMADFEPTLIHDGWAAMSRLMQRRNVPLAVILDLWIPGIKGHEILNTIRTQWPEALLYVFSSHDEMASKIPDDLIDGFYCKTEGIHKLINALRDDLSRHALTA